MKRYEVDILDETFIYETSNIHTAVSRAISYAKSKKMFKDKIGLYLKIGVERIV